MPSSACKSGDAVLSTVAVDHVAAAAADTDVVDATWRDRAVLAVVAGRQLRVHATSESGWTCTAAVDHIFAAVAGVQRVVTAEAPDRVTGGILRRQVVIPGRPDES